MTNINLPNNDEKLTPYLKFRDPILNFNFPGIKIGIAQYEEGPTGCTVFYFDKTENKKNPGAKFYADVRGGAPGVRFHEIGWASAICLEACDGVAAELLKMNNYSVDWMEIPVVPGAIIFDFGFRNNSIYPDKELGREEDILTNISSGEVYVGIVSFLIDNWKSPEEYLSREVLKVALFYAERLIKDFDYANRWLYNWNARLEAMEGEMRTIYGLLKPSIPFDFAKYTKVSQRSLK